VTDGFRYFEDFSEGDAAPQLRHEVTRTDLVVYAGASGDFNPMHTDEVTARAAGQPSVFGHGMFTAGYLAKAITDFLGVGNLQEYKVRFAKQTWPGETLVTSVNVSWKRAENGSGTIGLECSVANQDGETKLVGEATALLPRRAG
jgi:acyl dehydratase